MQQDGAPASPTTGTQRAFEVALDHIERLVLAGELGVGDRLPPERDMAAQLGVSRPAVREAIRTLEAQGVLESHVGSGASAGTHVTNQRSEALGRLLRLQVALAQFPIDEVVTTRITLERTSCELAAAHADAAGIAQLDALVQQMAELSQPHEYNEVDTRFHVAIAQLGGNQLIADLTSAVRDSLRLPILAAERRVSGWPELRSTLQAEHRGICEALARRDGKLAADRVEAHIRNSYAVLLRDGDPAAPAGVPTAPSWVAPGPGNN